MYVTFGLIMAAIILIAFQVMKGRSSAEIEQIRSAWGNPKAKDDFHFVRIGRYAEIEKEKFHRLTDQTMEDIDFYRLFKFIDRTTSRIGQQFLYKKAIEPADSTTHQSEELIKLFSNNKDLRERIQVELVKLNSTDAYHISSLLFNTFLEKPKWFSLLVINIALMIGLSILSFKFPILLLFLIIPISINMLLHVWNKNNTFHYTQSIPQLRLLIKVSRELIKNGGILYSQSVEESILNMKPFEKKAGFIRFNEGGAVSDFTQYFFDVIKAFFLIEVFMIFNVIEELKTKRSSIITLFDYVGNIDASISIASLRAGKLKTCQPVFTSSGKEIVAKEIYHPLIRDCVKNNLTISKKSILITGSNMSGKSTFLRTLIINSILAQTIYTCFAEYYSTPVLKQFSSIHIDDNLFEGKSYYFQEVSIMSSLIAEVDLPGQNLFVLDEVFKGTNTIERISAAKAILSYLNRKDNIVIVSTHDIELADMLGDEYDLYHFTETIESDELHFDHTIKRGQLTSRNAIKLLELADYPSDIIAEARQISSLLAKPAPGRERATNS